MFAEPTHTTWLREPDPDPLDELDSLPSRVVEYELELIGRLAARIAEDER